MASINMPKIHRFAKPVDNQTPSLLTPVQTIGIPAEDRPEGAAPLSADTVAEGLTFLQGCQRRVARFEDGE